MANFVKDANQLMDMNASGVSDGINLPFTIILSDGRFNKNHVRKYLREAQEKRYLYIFVILDPSAPKEAGTGTLGTTGTKKAADSSIMSMKSVEKVEVGSGSAASGVKLVPYLKDFPFQHYVIVRDVQELGQALS